MCILLMHSCHSAQSVARQQTSTTIGMSTDQIQINCPAKPITHAFLQFTDNDDRDKFVRSANTLKTESSRIVGIRRRMKGYDYVQSR